MAYYLALERKPYSYEAINIKKTPLGRNLFLNSACECTLEELDLFTTQYLNLEQLTHELYFDKFIPWSNSSIAIVYQNDDGIEIEKNMLFKESRKYLDNPSIVIEYLLNKFSACNIEFVRDLYLTLNDPKEQETIKALIGKMKSKLAYDTPLETTELTQVAELLVYNKDESENIHEPRLYEYSKIHNIVLVIAKYENKLKQNKQAKIRKRTKNT